MSWSNVWEAVDTVAILLGIVYLVLRQFFWRDARPSRMLLLPVIVTAYGVGSVGWDAWHGEQLTPADFAVMAGELTLVCCTGAVMGLRTKFRRTGGKLQYKLDVWGVLLWAVFIAIRLGSFALSTHLGAHLLETTGAIMISFGINRVACSVIVRRRSLRGIAAALTDAHDERSQPASAG